MDADDLAEFESNSYYDREFEAKEDDVSLKEEEPRHPNDLGGVLPPEQDLSLVPFVNEHHHHATTPSGHESLMQPNTAKRKLTGEEATSDSRKRQQFTNMVSGSSLTPPYSQMTQLPDDQYPTLSQRTIRLAQPPSQYFDQMTNQLAAQLPYDQYPTLNQTTNRQQDSSSQHGPDAAAPVQQRTQSQRRNVTWSTARRGIQDSAHQRRRDHPSVSQNRGRNHSNQPPGMQQGLPTTRPDMNQQSINPNLSYLRFCHGYFSSQAGTIDQQHSGPPMNIQEPSPDTTLLPEIQPQGFNPGELSYQEGYGKPPQQRQETEPHGVNLESHLTKEDKDVEEDEIDSI